LFSLEMSNTANAERLVASEGQVEAQRMRTAQLEQKHWTRIHAAMGRLSEQPIWFDDAGGLTISEIRARARRWRMIEAKGEHALIVVDYLQLISGSKEKGKSREQELSEISRGLKALAKDLRCPVVALSQLNRSLESRVDKRPMMSDLRESGAIEQDADVIAFLYRDEVYNPETESPGIAELIVSKQRTGPVGTLKLNWNSETTTFSNMTNRTYP
jgi:replicative DNA helicase